MDVTIYLPDDLGTWAKDAGINLSATLRGRVQAERDRRMISAALQEDAGIYELTVEDAETGHAYTARFHGTPLHDQRGGTQAYLGEDGKVWVYNENKNNLYQVPEDVISVDEALSEALMEGEYIEAMAVLGRAATIDVGRKS